MKIISGTLHKRTQLICWLCLQLLSSLQLSAGSFLSVGFPQLSSLPGLSFVKLLAAEACRYWLTGCCWGSPVSARRV